MIKQKKCELFIHLPIFTTIVNKKYSGAQHRELVTTCSRCGNKLTDEEILFSLENTYPTEYAEHIYMAYINKDAFYDRFNRLSRLAIKSSLFSELY